MTSRAMPNEWLDVARLTRDMDEKASQQVEAEYQAALFDEHVTVSNPVYDDLLPRARLMWRDSSAIMQRIARTYPDSWDHSPGIRR